MLFQIYCFRFQLLVWFTCIQGLSALPVGDNTLPVEFPHSSKLKGILNDMCFGSKNRIVPHPEDCAMYYNCTSIYRVVPLYMEQNLHECPYPKLFSTETEQCEMYHRVKCGKRTEPKWECQYRKHWCKDNECLTPCASKYPSCIGKSDGRNPYRGQNLLSYYLECKNERVVRIKICPRVPILTRFSPLTKRCEALYRIPVEYSRINTICRNKEDGYHADTFGRCKNYFRCTNGRFESFGTCLGTKLFDPKRRICAKAETICGRCGTAGQKCKYVQTTNMTGIDSQDTPSSTESVSPVKGEKFTTGSLLTTILSRHVTTIPGTATSHVTTDPGTATSHVTNIRGTTTSLVITSPTTVTGHVTTSSGTVTSRRTSSPRTATSHGTSGSGTATSHGTSSPRTATSHATSSPKTATSKEIFNANTNGSSANTTEIDRSYFTETIQHSSSEHTTPSYEKNFIGIKEHSSPEHITASNDKDFIGSKSHSSPEHITASNDKDFIGSKEHSSPEHTTASNDKDFIEIKEHSSPEHITPSNDKDFIGIKEHSTPEHITPSNDKDFIGMKEHSTPEHITPSNGMTFTENKEYSTPEHITTSNNVVSTESKEHISSDYTTQSGNQDFTRI